MSLEQAFDVVVVGGGPAGATAAHDLARQGRHVALLDKAGRIKPCGGAIPPRLIRDFDIPAHLLVARVNAARMISPSDREVDMPIDGGYVGMVERASFDEFLRVRAAEAGAERLTGEFQRIEHDADGMAVIVYTAKGDTAEQRLRTRCIIGADGARSQVAKQSVKGAEKIPCVFAYHEIVEAPTDQAPKYDPLRCDVFYQGKLSPDFYAWIFPHGDKVSIGTGSAHKGFSLRGSVGELRAATGLDKVATIRREGAPIPLKPLKRWDNGRDVVLAGDSAGVVAPSSGEGIYYAMLCGRLAADSAAEFCATGRASALATARKRFMKAHGRVFLILGIMQYFWYSSDKRREKFVAICQDKDVQRLTWEAYMNKELSRPSPLTHIKIFLKDMAHLMGLAGPRLDHPASTSRGDA
ncbi:geranylgeranyl diphosphate reductase [Roseomonas sp. F4]